MKKWQWTLRLALLFTAQANANEVSNLDGVIKWRLNIGHSMGGVAIGHDGTVYVPVFREGVKAVNPDGTVKWQVDMPGYVYGVPSVDKHGNIYGGPDNGALYSINPDGEINWTFGAGIRLRDAPSILKSGDIVFNNGYSQLLRVSPAGELVWSKNFGVSYNNKIAIDERDNLYFCSGGSQRRYLSSLNEHGDFRWSRDVGTSCDDNHVSLDSQQNAYLGVSHHPNVISSFTQEGALRWQVPTRSISRGTATIDAQGSVILPMYAYLYRVTATGGITELTGLRQTTDAAVLREDGSMIVSSDYFGTVKALDNSGNQKWSLRVGRITRSVAIDTNGTIYFTSEDGYLNALHGNSPLADSPWPKYGQNNQNTGRVQTELLNQGGKLEWAFDTNHAINASPLVTADSVYVGNDAGVLTALDKAQNKRWDFATSASIKAAPLLLNDTLYIGNSSGDIYGISLDGSQQWRTQVVGSIVASPLAVGDDIVVATIGGRVSLLNASGEVQWTTQLNGPIYAQPQIDPLGTIYVGTATNVLYALNVYGDIQWQTNLTDRITSDVAFNRAGLVVATLDGKVSQLDFNGNMLWQTALDGRIAYSSPVVSSDGDIYLGSFDKHLYKLNADGVIQWKAATEGWLKGSPIVLSNGNIVIGSFDKHLYSFRPTGELAWKFATQGNIQTTAARDNDDKVYIGSNDGKLYVVKGL